MSRRIQHAIGDGLAWLVLKLFPKLAKSIKDTTS